MSDLLSLGDLTTPEFVDVTLEREGRTVILNAYKNGPRCPGIIKGMISNAKREYDEATDWGKTEPKFDLNGEPVMDDKGEPVMISIFHPENDAWYRMLRKQIQTVIQGLTDDEADMLAGNDVTCLAVLRELDWWPKQVDETELDTAAGEVTGEEAEESTTPVSSPS